jgi:hypothetical protein
LPPIRGNHDALDKPFRDPAAVFVLQKIVLGLCQQGYEVTGPRHGKSCDAIVKCKFKNFGMTVVLNVSRRERGIVRFRLLTWKTRRQLSLFRPEEESTLEIEEHWGALCLAIDKQLRQITGVEPVLWLTRSEAERRWSEQRAAY